jgi:hypothetical protein
MADSTGRWRTKQAVRSVEMPNSAVPLARPACSPLTQVSMGMLRSTCAWGSKKISAWTRPSAGESREGQPPRGARGVAVEAGDVPRLALTMYSYASSAKSSSVTRADMATFCVPSTRQISTRPSHRAVVARPISRRYLDRAADGEDVRSS